MKLETILGFLSSTICNWYGQDMKVWVTGKQKVVKQEGSQPFLRVFEGIEKCFIGSWWTIFVKNKYLINL